MLINTTATFFLTLIAMSYGGEVACEHCGGGSECFVDTEADIVCGNCGFVFRGNCQFGAEFKQLCSVSRMDSRFQRIFHFNERLACFTCSEPDIPYEDMAQILLAARHPKFDEDTLRSKASIQAVLRLVKSNPSHKVEKTRWAYHTSDFCNRTFSIYLERWPSIVLAISQDRCEAGPLAPSTPKPSHTILTWLRERFKDLQAPFERVRHKSECTSYARVCKEVKCRKNFPNYDLIIRSLFILADYVGNFRDDHPLTLLHFFPGLKTKGKISDFISIFTKMVGETSWFWAPEQDELDALLRRYLVG